MNKRLKVEAEYYETMALYHRLLCAAELANTTRHKHIKDAFKVKVWDLALEVQGRARDLYAEHEGEER